MMIRFVGEGGSVVIYATIIVSFFIIVSEVVAKTFAKAIGARAIPLIGWGITIGTAGVGVYKMVFDEKPFVAKVILVDQDGVHKICNE